MRKLTFLVVLLICIGLTGTARADQCVTAYKSKDYTSAEVICRKAAEQGHELAPFLLGVMYYLGQGVTQDYAEAAKWLRKAAAQGSAEAQFLLGGMYTDGLGVTKDYAEAVKWYRKAAEQGGGQAQFTLGGMYEKGQGVAQDFVKAHALFNIAAARGVSIGAEQRDKVAKKMTAADISKAQQLASKCAKKDYKNCGF